MLWTRFFKDREFLDNQYGRIDWGGFSPETFEKEALQFSNSLESRKLPKARVKAELFAWVLNNAPVAVDPYDFFQDHLAHCNVVQKQRQRWIDEVLDRELPDIKKEAQKAYDLGAWTASYDFGHTVPDWYSVLALGFPGLLARLKETRFRRETSGGLTAGQRVFYEASETVCVSVLRYIKRLAGGCIKAAAEETDKVLQSRLSFCAKTLDEISGHEPRTLHEALQTAYIYHILHEEVEGERLRSLGGFDRLYGRFYRADLESGRFSRQELKTMVQYFFQKFHALTGDHFFGEPVFIGGTLADGSCAVDDFTELVVDAFDELNIANPKFQARISKDTPAGFIEKVCGCIRRGNSSFVFVSDECAIPMMQNTGATLEEAREYAPIGCYEPGILGKEVACTQNGGFSMPKAVELALHNGVDPLSGEKLGAETGGPSGFTEFRDLLEAVKVQQRFFIDRAANTVREMEKWYMEMNPSPLFSATMAECVERGKDAYAGGAKYNNSSLWAYGNGTMADELAAIDKLVYKNREISLPALVQILDNDWAGNENLRRRMLNDPDKWGNNREAPDKICAEIAADCADAINRQPNVRGGRFKAAMFTIDYFIYWGSKAGASADGRKSGEPLSKNMGAVTAMDRNGVTALIQSVTKLDHKAFPNGSVLDFVLHPSAVMGEEGLKAFTGLIQSYMDLGGYAIHGNVFDAGILKDAQEHPDSYRNLQIRVCGWNVYFVNLSRKEQDIFIRQAENAV
jgi:formate C-acetyltransferase